MIDIRQTKPYAEYIKRNGWIVEGGEGEYIFIRKFPLIGSFIKVQRPEKINKVFLQKIENTAKKFRSVQIVIEPKSKKDKKLLLNYGYKQSKNPYLPSKTLELDLTISNQKLFSALHKNAKHSLHITENLILSRNPDVKSFQQAWKNSIGYRRYVPSKHKLEYIMGCFASSALFLASHNNNLISKNTVTAGAIFLIADKKAYYWQAFANKEGRGQLAPYRLLWEGILWSKAMGAKAFDFEGIYDNRFPNKSWLGFSYFKGKFGGHKVVYPGAYTKTTLTNMLR